MRIPENDDARLRLGLDFTQGIEAGSVEISGVDHDGSGAAAGILVGDVVDEIDDGLPDQQAEHVVAGWCDGTRPRRSDFPITMRVRRSGEVLTFKLWWNVRPTAPIADSEQAEPVAAESTPETPFAHLGAISDQEISEQPSSGPLNSRVEANVTSLRSHLGRGPQDPCVIAELQRQRRARGSYTTEYNPYREPIWSGE